MFFPRRVELLNTTMIQSVEKGKMSSLTTATPSSAPPSFENRVKKISPRKLFSIRGTLEDNTQPVHLLRN
jgi:hypothetical protein